MNMTRQLILLISGNRKQLVIRSRREWSSRRLDDRLWQNKALIRRRCRHPSYSPTTLGGRKSRRWISLRPWFSHQHVCQTHGRNGSRVLTWKLKNTYHFSRPCNLLADESRPRLDADEHQWWIWSWEISVQLHPAITDPKVTKIFLEWIKKIGYLTEIHLK